MPHVWFDDTVTVPSSTPGSVWFDAATYGATGDGATDDTGSLQAAIDAAVDAGGGVVWVGPGTYRLTAALTIQMSGTLKGVQVWGSGNNTKIVQQTTADVFQIGRTGAEVADFIVIRDLWLSGGRYGLNLNNCLRGTFKNLLIQGMTVGVYLQGQNESHTFENLQIDGCSLYGISGGNTNGGTGSVLDYPIVQKSVFDHIRVSSTSGGVAILMTAGVLGNQQVSGSNRFTGLLFESNAKGDLEFNWSQLTMVDGVSNEDALDADNTYAAVTVVNGSTVSLRGALLGDSGSNRYKYLCYVHGATLMISESFFTGTGTAQIHNHGGGTALNVLNTFITSAAHLDFADATCRALSQVIGVRDASAILIESDTIVTDTASLPAAGTALNGTLIIENAGAGDRNLILYAGGQRFRIDGGTAF